MLLLIMGLLPAVESILIAKQSFLVNPILAILLYLDEPRWWKEMQLIKNIFIPLFVTLSLQ